MASPPTFVFTAPSERRPSVISANGTVGTDAAGAAHHAGLLHYLPQRASELGDKDLSTNAVPPTPPPRSRSVSPLPAESMHRVSSRKKENEGPYGANVWFGGPPPKATTTESEISESSRVLRGRTLRVNTLHQRVYHSQDASPINYPLDGLSPRAESLSPMEITPDKDFLLPHTSPLLPSPSKTKFFQSNAATTRISTSNLLRWIPALPDSPQLWLALYFALNLSLTLYNKSVLIHFPFPYTLTALHALCGTIGTYVLLRLESSANSSRGAQRLISNPMPNLKGRELLVLFLFSILYTLNIVVSNASLRLVTVPFHQVVRASAPFFTIMFAAMLLGRRCSRRKLLSLIPVVAGVAFATYGDYYFTTFGFFLTLLGTLLAALKTTLTNVILTKPTQAGLPLSSDPNHILQEESTGLHNNSSQSYSAFPPTFFSSLAALITNTLFPSSPPSPTGYPLKPLTPPAPPSADALSTPSSFALPKLMLSPLHLLYLLSPLAFIQTTLLAHFTGELDRVRWHLFSGAVGGTGAASTGRMWLLLNGILAFFLNVVSFNANRRVGPLGMSVAANVKQVLTILCAVVIFNLTITTANGVGIALTLLGGALYAAVELREKEEKKSRMG